MSAPGGVKIDYQAGLKDSLGVRMPVVGGAAGGSRKAVTRKNPLPVTRTNPVGTASATASLDAQLWWWYGRASRGFVDEWRGRQAQG